MNIKNLTQGMIVKNYKELCTLIGEEPKSGGNSKKSQLKELERYISYHKEGNKFVIDDIYDEVKEKEDKRLVVSEDDPRREGFTSLYRDDISRLILNLLAQSNSGRLFLSIGKLTNELKMVNGNYSHGRRNIPKLSEITNVPEEHIYYFYSNTQSKLKNSIETALNYLRRKSLIVWKTQLTVCIKQVQLELNELGEPRVTNGKISYNTNFIHRPATIEETQLILKIEEEIMKELDCIDLKEVFVKGHWNKFRSDVGKKVNYDANIEYYYDSYEIIYNHSSVLRQLDELEVFIRERSLNGNIIESVRNTAKRNHEKAKEKKMIEDASNLMTWGKNKPTQELSKITYIQAEDNYVDNNDILVHTVVNISANEIISQLREKVMKKELELLETKTDDEIPF